MKSTKKTLLLVMVLALVLAFAAGCQPQEEPVATEPAEHVHTLVHMDAKAPTCVNNGISEHWYCPECNARFSDAGATTEVTFADLEIEELGHTAGEDDGDCTTAVDCTVCGKVAIAAKPHTPAEDDGDCLTAVACTECDKNAVEAKDAHEAAEDDGDCTTAVTCKHCDHVFVAAAASHTPGQDDGDCTTAVACTECEKNAVEAKEAHEAEADDGNCTTAVKCAHCDVIVTEAKEAHADEDADYKCDTCGTKMLPEDGTVLTIPQALAIGKLYTKDTYTTQKYYITGVIKNVYNTKYGNMYIQDAEGNEICIFGLYSADGTTRYDAMSYKPVAGDEITVYTVLGYYNAPQGKDAWLDEVVAHEHDYTSVVTEPTCTKAGFTTHTCSICNAYYTDSEVDALGHTTDNGTCENCGKEISSDAPAYETFDADFNTLTANNSYSTYKTTSGWTGTNCAVAQGGSSNSNPTFTALGTAATKGFILNGKTSAKGTVTSPTLTGGVSAISFKYTNVFSESNGVDVTITIKQNGAVVASKQLDNNSVTQHTVYTFTWELDTPVSGDFTIEIVNNSPSNNSGNKDRVAIWDLTWTNNPTA